MGNQVVKELFVCRCSDIEHQISMAYEVDDEIKDVYCYIHLVRLPFWERVKNGIKYIFGYKSKYGDFEEFIFNPKDADALQKVVDYLKSCDKKDGENNEI